MCRLSFFRNKHPFKVGSYESRTSNLKILFSLLFPSVILSLFLHTDYTHRRTHTLGKQVLKLNLQQPYSTSKLSVTKHAKSTPTHNPAPNSQWIFTLIKIITFNKNMFYSVASSDHGLLQVRKFLRQVLWIKHSSMAFCR